MKKFSFFIVSLAFVSLVVSSCKNDDDDILDCDAYHWGYEGDDGPSSWSNCYSDCGGQAQSPINLIGDPADNSATALETHFEEVPIDLINNGHTIEFEYEAGSKINLNDEEYELLQFHFHTGSEHYINGTQYPMEVHMVSKNSAGNIAVIGVMFEEGNENAFLKNFSDNLPANEDDHFSSATKVNVGDLIPTIGGYYTYGGSLTTPPCSEIVTWIVMKAPVQASAAQISNFHTIMHDNFRPLQDLNGRVVSEYDCSDYHWDYAGDSTPDTWSICYGDCGGSAQSPINITGAVSDAGLTALDVHYEAVPTELINNGHTVEFEYEAGSKLVINGENFDLLQFHFHTGSEHTVGGTQYAMEAHLVHKNASTGQLAVIGVFFEEGNENDFLKNFNDNLPEAKDDHYSSMNMVNVEDLLPAGTGYYNYTGSLTTPPCSEIVNWFVMKEPVYASAAQISKMHGIIHDNYRPTQNLNSRAIKEFN